MSDINIVLENRDDIHVAVEEKDINVEVPAGKDGRSLRPRGEWSASVAYAYLDLVSYQGSSYVALKAVPAGTLPTDTSYWMLSAEKGDPGDPGTPVWGAITGDLSDQTDLQTVLDAKAPVILNSASGSIASFTDGSPAPVTALSVGIEPVQDLHGYDNPWPAGGGKNKLRMPYSDGTQKIESGITWSVNSEGIITVNGTSTANTDFYFYGKSNQYIDMGLDSGTYTISINLTGTFTGLQWFIVNSNGTTIIAKSFDSSSYAQTATIDSSASYRFFLRTLSGETLNCTAKIQIESGSTATSWTPYSNVCPISGHTSATVTRTGKNLFPFTDFVGWSNGYLRSNGLPSGDTPISPSYEKTSPFFKINGGQTYTFSNTFSTETPGGVSAYICFYDGNQNFVGTRTKNTGITSVITATAPSNAEFARVSMRTFDSAKEMQLELGSSATAYEAPSIQTVTIDLDGTRYGGTLNVLTGEMTVTKAYIHLDGTQDIFSFGWRNSDTSIGIAYNKNVVDNPFCPDNKILDGLISDTLPASTYSDLYYQRVDNGIGVLGQASNYSLFIRIAHPELTTKELFNAWIANNPITVICPLATPLTVQLTPAQLSTLLGQNNIWADTGDVSVEYRADTKRYIDGVASATAKVTRQMIADSATADGKAPKSLAIGDLIIVGDELRKATTNIGNGSAITASNSTTATLADVIKALQ